VFVWVGFKSHLGCHKHLLRSSRNESQVSDKWYCGIPWTLTHKTKSKVGVINEQVRGELAGQRSAEGVDSIHVGGAMTKPKLDVVNPQLRTEEARKARAADTGATRAQIRATECGEFESKPQPSSADTGIMGAPIRQTESGEFESTPQPHFS